MLPDGEEVIFVKRDEEQTHPFHSNCDHIMGLWCMPVHQSDLERIPALLTGKVQHFERYSYCPQCGTKLAPIFAVLEAKQ